MPVPFLNLKLQYKALQAEIDGAIRQVLESAAYVGNGPNVAPFEEEFASYCGTQYCAAVKSGTDALRFALMAIGMKPGDEVITVPNTFIATTEAISQAGAKPVFVDVDPATMLMDPTKLPDAITPKTKAIIPVHLAGLCADMDPILKISDYYGVPVIEDACQAHGARYKGRRAGSMGAAGCFSFYPGKNLGAFGEGGAIVSNDPEMIEKAKMIRDHGQREKYIHEVEGYNGRLDTLQAEVLRVKLRRLDEWNEARRRNADIYRELLADLPVELPVIPENCQSVFHLFMIQTDERQAVIDALKASGIGWGLHYPVPLHLQQAYASMGYRRGAFPVAERFADRILSLPMFAEISREQIEEVAGVVRQAIGQPALQMA